ncbi:hypothetical protein [Novosphingobium sp. BL-52-GroH]|uniref:hypothetical protein n=1 Tax=Novosphingobium sp. BL-52-GroH TaxID=3349877 RepID=UPI00384DF4AF
MKSFTITDTANPAATLQFIEAFNRDLEGLDSSARVAAPQERDDLAMLELLDDEGLVLALIPSSTSPVMAAIAFALYSQAFTRGVEAGERAAWAKLRSLIGAADG